jgi:membrane associated rhomboid family serine protease
MALTPEQWWFKRNFVCSIIHGDLNHILNNSLPVFILGSMIFYFYKPIAWPSIFWIYLLVDFGYGLEAEIMM